MQSAIKCSIDSSSIPQNLHVSVPFYVGACCSIQKDVQSCDFDSLDEAALSKKQELLEKLYVNFEAVQGLLEHKDRNEMESTLPAEASAICTTFLEAFDTQQQLSSFAILSDAPCPRRDTSLSYRLFASMT
ncbi:hypothetical protein EVAR_72606_1 [Eumeta japonica]|uniref:Uncharacterized protein n=1 Tax=Eumeta variegata TaxID=151549 RepID=A0A4C1TIR1_EUMVA|nr:hypothetical protein EVAR_72606_1 [Eumeta japonica]